MVYPAQNFPQVQPDPLRDIAGFEVIAGQTPFQLWVGDIQIITDSAPALTAIVKHQVVALTATGVTTFIPGTHTGREAVVAAQSAEIGEQCPYWNEGYFNHEALLWPAGTALDTYAERKALLIGANIRVGHLI